MLIVIKQMWLGLVNIIPYALLSVIPAFYVADRVMTEMKKDQKK